MRFHYDKMLCRAFEQSTVKKVPLHNFVRSHRGPLAMFASSDHIDHCLDAMFKGEAANPTVLRQMIDTSSISGKVFADLAAKMNLVNFLEEVKLQVTVLGDNGFTPSDTSSFNTVCGDRAEELISSGFGRFEKLQVTVPFLRQNMSLHAQGPAEVFGLFHIAERTTIAINTGKLQMLPWEQLLFTPGQMDGVPTAVDVWMEPLGNKANARDFMLRLLGEDRLTISQMRKEINANLKALQAMDRYCVLEVTFLNELAEKFVEQQVHQQVFAALPTERASSMSQVPNGVIQTIASLQDFDFFELLRFIKVLVALEKIKSSALCYSGGSTLEGEISGVISLVKGLMEQNPPSDAYLQSCTLFFKACLKMMENFITVERRVCAPVEKGKLAFAAPKVELLFGKKALTYMFEDFEAKFTKGLKNVSLKEVAVFRTFHWALTGAQKKRLQQIRGLAIS
jgi:hypothetical protein